MARPGPIAFISQSGALGAAILDWSLRANVGFSAFVSVGSMLDVGWGELIDYLGNDAQTKSIVVYMESIGDARSFLSAAREVALSKPIIVLKGGRTEAAARAAASHTGSLVGSDEALHAAFRRCGVLRVGSIDELFNVSDLLAKQPRPRGPRLTILTNAGGPGVLATDELITSGGALARLPRETWRRSIRRCRRTGATTTRSTSWATPGRIATPAAARWPAEPRQRWAAGDPHAPGDGRPDRHGRAAPGDRQGWIKPLLASWMGGANVAEGEAILQSRQHPDLPLPRHRRARISLDSGATATTCTACTKRRSCRPRPTRSRPSAPQAEQHMRLASWLVAAPC